MTTKIITIRFEDRDLQALDGFADEEGVDRSTAIRLALTQALANRRSERLRRESRTLASDPQDLEEMRNVAHDMKHLRTW